MNRDTCSAGSGRMKCLRCVDDFDDVFCAGHNGIYSRYVAEGLTGVEAAKATMLCGKFTAARRLHFSPLLHQLALTRAFISRNRGVALEADDLVASDAD